MRQRIEAMRVFYIEADPLLAPVKFNVPNRYTLIASFPSLWISYLLSSLILQTSHFHHSPGELDVIALVEDLAYTYLKILKLSNPKILGAPGASCGRFSIPYSRLRFLFPFGGQMGFSKWLIMTHFSHPGKKYNRSCLLSLENNSRHANEGARYTFGFESLKMFTFNLLMSLTWDARQIEFEF